MWSVSSVLCARSDRSVHVDFDAPTESAVDSSDNSQRSVAECDPRRRDTTRRVRENHVRVKAL